MKLRAEDMFGPASDPFDPAIDGSGADREIVMWVDEDADLVALLHVTRDDLPRLDRLSHALTRIDSGGMILEAAARLSPAWLDRPLDDDDRALETVMLGLRLREGLPLDLLSDLGRRRAADAVARGLLDEAAHARGRAVLTDPGRLLADALVRDLTD